MDDQNVPILMYHSVSPSTNPLFRRWAVTPMMFDAHMSYLRRHHYTPITVTDLVQAYAGGGKPLPEKPVVLTFDDAYADFYEFAFPILRRFGFAATLYIPTAYVGGTASWLEREGETGRPMATWSQLEEVSAGGIECGGHGHTHLQMDAIPLDTAETEIRRSKALIEDHLGCEALSFAYPHGWTTAPVKRLVQAAGYTSACAVKNMHSAPTDDPFELSRLLVSGELNVDDLGRLIAHRMAPLEVTLRNIARPVMRLMPRTSARRRSYGPLAKSALSGAVSEQPQAR